MAIDPVTVSRDGVGVDEVSGLIASGRGATTDIQGDLGPHPGVDRNEMTSRPHAHLTHRSGAVLRGAD